MNDLLAKLEPYKVYVDQLKMDMVPFSEVKKVLENDQVGKVVKELQDAIDFYNSSIATIIKEAENEY